jgi:iron complex transport system permease protein
MAVDSVRARTAARVRARGISRPWQLCAGAFLVASLLVGLGVGPVGIGGIAIVESSLSHIPLVHVHSPLSSVQEAILWQLRAPRVVLAALVGGMLAIAGSAYQGVFRNPLADPYLLGVAAGAGLGATIAIAFRVSTGTGQLVPVAAFAGGLVAVAFAYVLGRSVGSARATGALVLAGVTVAAFMTALQTFVQQQRTDTLRDVYAWLLGGFSTSSWNDVAVAAPYIVVSSIVLILHRRVLDVMSLGDDEAASLGINVRRTRLLVVAAATAGTAAAVSVSGLIGFVGIIVPHTIRLLVSTSYRAVVVLSFVVGGGFLVLTDVVARTIVSPAELPLGVVTAFLGAPFFAVVLRTSRSIR